MNDTMHECKGMVAQSPYQMESCEEPAKEEVEEEEEEEEVIDDNDTSCLPGGKRSARHDVKDRYKRKNTIQESAVKMTLNQLCSDSQLQREIEVCVEGVTRTSVEASRFINLWVLTLLEQGQIVPKLNQTFFNAAFTTMAGGTLSRPKFGAALHQYEQVRPADMARFNYRHVSQMLNYAGVEYMIACKNHVVLNISGRVGKAFKLFFDRLPQHFKAEDRNKARRYYLKRMSRECGPEEEAPMWQSFKSVPTQATRAAVVAYINLRLERYTDLPLDTGGLHPTKQVEKRWWDYLRWLYDLQIEMSFYETRAFSILPLCGFACKHVTIDTGILRGLLFRVAERTGCAKPEDLPQFRSNSRQHWETYFNLSKAEGKNKRRDFETMLKTDGYAVSVVLSKTLAEGTVKKRGKKMHAAFAATATAQDIAGKRVVAVDPGRIDLATCAWTADDEEKTPSFCRYSNKEYQAKIGLKSAHVKRRQWMSTAGLQEALNQLPTAKTPRTFLMLAHIAELFNILDRLLQLNGMRRVRSMRFSQHCLRQRVMYDICQRITASADPSDKRPVVVAFGAGMFNSCSRGHCPGPVKAVRKALRRRGVEVYDVNEDYTSQLCNSCHSKVVPMYSKGGGKAIYSVRRCTTTTCMRMTMNRDVNAALNILYIFMAETLHGSRPEVFTRRYQTELARATVP